MQITAKAFGCAMGDTDNEWIAAGYAPPSVPYGYLKRTLQKLGIEIVGENDSIPQPPEDARLVDLFSEPEG